MLDNKSTARLAPLDELIANVIPAFISPVPSRETLRAWFDAAKVPRFKSNPTAKRGGGTVFYSVAGVEKFFRSRTMIKAA
jgi:trehalose utilization protein